MASVAAIAIKRETSLKRLNESMSDIGERLGLDVPSVPSSGRDKDFLQAQQLEALAGFFEQVRDKLAPASETDEPSADSAAWQSGSTTEVWNIPEGESIESAIPALAPEERERLFERIEREYTVAELKQIADENAVEYQANIRKDALINLLVDSGLADWGKPNGDTSDE